MDRLLEFAVGYFILVVISFPVVVVLLHRAPVVEEEELSKRYTLSDNK